jgi:excisionase family DNA binding protein
MTKSQRVDVSSAVLREEILEDAGFVTVPVAARYLQLSRAKLYQMMDAGDLKYCKFGKSRRIPRRALAELVEKCLVTQ